MVYLQYHIETKQVVEIHDSEPIISIGYDYAISADFSVGDEFEQTIWINVVDKNKNLVSHSAIRNNPQATRLLKENQQLKEENVDLQSRVTTTQQAVDFLLMGGM
jgi:hypothetical protein